MRGTVAKSFRKKAREEKKLNPNINVARRSDELKWLYKKNTGHLIEQFPKLKLSRRQQRLQKDALQKSNL